MDRGSARSTFADIHFLAGSIVAMAVAMGVGRFAYTPLLPVMQQQAGLGTALAGAVASANLLGYVVGAIISMQRWTHTRRIALLRWSVIGVIATTALMAVPSHPWWLVCRFLTGIASGFVFVLASSIVLDRAAVRGKPIWPAFFYGGVGIGIAASGALTPYFVGLGGWTWGWLGLAAVSAVFVLPTLGAVNEPDRAPAPVDAENASAPASSRDFRRVCIAYGGEGFGYIIPATFLVTIVSHVPSIASLAPSTWILVGLLGIPSTFVWSRVADKTGRRLALAIAFFLQAVGIVAPAIAPNALGATIAAATLGSTFMGISSLTTGLGRAMYPARSHGAIGALTVAYGIGQVLGPLTTSGLVLRFGNYNAALVVAAVVVLVGGVLFALPSPTSRA